MKKPFAAAVLCAFLALALGVPAAPAAESPDGKITINKPASVFPAKKLGPNGVKAKNPVTFNHRKHGTQFACAQCHHKEPQLKAGGAASSCFGGKCHGAEAIRNAEARLVDSYSVIHDKKWGLCVNCHGNNDMAKAAKAPTKCSGCHGGKDE